MTERVCLCVMECLCLTIRFCGDLEGGGALSWPNIVISDNSEAVALLWLQVGNCQLQRLRL